MKVNFDNNILFKKLGLEVEISRRPFLSPVLLIIIEANGNFKKTNRGLNNGRKYLTKWKNQLTDNNNKLRMLN